MIWRVGRSREVCQHFSRRMASGFVGRNTWWPSCDVASVSNKLAIFFFQFPRLEIVLWRAFTRDVYILPPKKNILPPGKRTNMSPKKGDELSIENTNPSILQGDLRSFFRGCCATWLKAERIFSWGETELEISACPAEYSDLFFARVKKPKMWWF